MKNIKYLLLILPFMFISNVKADVLTKTIDLLNDNYDYEINKSFYENNKDILSKLYDDVYSYYVENYKSDYPYYLVNFTSSFGQLTSPNSISIHFYLFDTIPNFSLSSNSVPSVSANYILEYTYRSSDSSYILPISEITEGSDISIFSYIFQTSSISYYDYFYSNFDLIINLSDSNSMILNYDYSLPNTFKLSYLNGDTFIPLQEAMGLDIIKDPDLLSSGYKEIDLNNYSYVALSLKDYSKTEEFVTTVQVKGQYCLTPVYNYGMTEKKDIFNGSKTKRCSLYYENYTPVRTYILKQDLENHAIYYLKAYDTSKENKVQVDTSIFNITYFNEDNKDDPYVIINGKSYPTIPYDNLTDSATISEKEEYNDGTSCAVGDFNCTANAYGKSFSWSDIFTSPIDFLKNIWESIVNVFILINYFISILPITLQYFLYISFMLAIILGLIKIII